MPEFMSERFEFEGKEGLTAGGLARAVQDELARVCGDGEARAMTRLMFHHLKGWSVTDMIVNADRPASEYLVSKTAGILRRVLAGEPIQYVLGESRFYGMDLEVTPAVLIPRPETEELVDMIVRENRRPDLRVLDVGTGSGAIAIALSRNLPFSKVTAIDISEEALAVARTNAARLHAEINFMHEDIFRFEPEADSFDIIVSNPPYIAESERKDMEPNVLEHEPEGALFVPDDNPLVYYSRISEIAMTALVGSGRLYYEINPDYASRLTTMLEADGFTDVEIRKDISRRDRFAVARKAEK